MRLSPARYLGLLGVLAAAGAAGVIVSARATAELRRQPDQGHAEEHALHALRQERDTLIAQQPSITRLEELVREQGALEAERAALQELRGGYQRAVLEAMRRPDPPSLPSRVPSDRASPAATIQSVVYAVADGEVDELAGLIDFDPAARAEAERFFASLPPDLRTQYRSPDQLVAHVMTAKTKLGTSPVQFGAMTFAGPDDVSLRVNVQRPGGAPFSAILQLHRHTEGWKLRVPAKVIEGYRALVTGVAPTVAASATVP